MSFFPLCEQACILAVGRGQPSVVWEDDLKGMYSAIYHCPLSYQAFLHFFRFIYIYGVYCVLLYIYILCLMYFDQVWSYHNLVFAQSDPGQGKPCAVTKVTLTLSADHRVVGDDIGGLIPQFTFSSKFLYLLLWNFILDNEW